MQNTTESLALVGRFLQSWSNVEQAMHLAISAATKLSPLMNAIVCANLTLRAKLSILQSLVDVSDLKDSQKADLKKLLRKIGAFSENRNLIAHECFGIIEGEPGIGFMRVKARGKFKSSFIAWTRKAFQAHDKTMRSYYDELMQLTVRLETSKFEVDDFTTLLQIVGSSARGPAK